MGRLHDALGRLMDQGDLRKALAQLQAERDNLIEKEAAMSMAIREAEERIHRLQHDQSVARQSGENSALLIATSELAAALDVRLPALQNSDDLKLAWHDLIARVRTRCPQ